MTTTGYYVKSGVALNSGRFHLNNFSLSLSSLTSSSSSYRLEMAV